MPHFFRNLSRFDWLLFVAALLLSILGLAAIGSVGLGHDVPSFTGVTKQAVALAVGIFLALVIGSVNFRVLDHYARPLYLLALALLAAVLFFGKTVNGTRGWFQIAGWGIQPVEFAKLALIVILARFMSKHSHVRDLSSLARSALVAGLLVALVLLQPDFGSAMIIFGIWCAMLLFAGVRRRHLVVFLTAFVAVAALAWFFVLQPYQKDRVLTFLDPSRAPLTRGYNITQARIAIGAGGLFGRGLGFGSQSQLRFLPEAQTDFIFAVIGEELGFVAVLALFGLFALFFARILRLAKKSGDNFTFFIAIGLLTQIFLELTVNAGMNLGLLPVTGIALPFLSAGGSSLVASWVAVGILQSVAVREEGARSSLTEDAAGVTIEL